jgi:hypothetical protein
MSAAPHGEPSELGRLAILVIAALTDLSLGIPVINRKGARSRARKGTGHGYCPESSILLSRRQRGMGANHVSHDSRHDTEQHIARVQALLGEFAAVLLDRGAIHDRSKLEEPEKAAFDRLSPQLREVTYGSPEYLDSLDQLGDALTHH